MAVCRITRRDLFGAAIALGVGGAEAAPDNRDGLAPLKSLTGMPVGCAVSNQAVREPEFTALLLRNFSQITPEMEMKMGVILRVDGSLDFTRPDRFMDFAEANSLRVHGHTLVWYAIEPAYFKGLDGKGGVFADAFQQYILAVAGRYRGRIAGWDVVNEPVAADGEGLRNSIWKKNLGSEDYMVRAFELARQADPGALLFVNDYNLEKFPKKRATFLSLTERLLKRGVKIDGIGTQCHLDIDLPRGACAAAMRDLARLGLKVHVSELDVSFGRSQIDIRSVDQKRAIQADRTKELLDAFMTLPEGQRYALTLWGLRDSDSFLRKPPRGRADDQPLPFDDSGQPKPMFQAMSDALRRTSFQAPR